MCASVFGLMLVLCCACLVCVCCFSSNVLCELVWVVVSSLCVVLCVLICSFVCVVGVLMFVLFCDWFVCACSFCLVLLCGLLLVVVFFFFVCVCCGERVAVRWLFCLCVYPCWCCAVPVL